MGSFLGGLGASKVEIPMERSSPALSFLPREGRLARGGRRSEPGEKGLGGQPCALAGAAPPAEPASGGEPAPPRPGPGPGAARGETPLNGTGEDGALHKPACHPPRSACGLQVSNNSLYPL